MCHVLAPSVGEAETAVRGAAWALWRACSWPICLSLLVGGGLSPFLTQRGWSRNAWVCPPSLHSSSPRGCPSAVQPTPRGMYNQAVNQHKLYFLTLQNHSFAFWWKILQDRRTLVFLCLCVCFWHSTRLHLSNKKVTTIILWNII